MKWYSEQINNTPTYCVLSNNKDVIIVTGGNSKATSEDIAMLMAHKDSIMESLKTANPKLFKKINGEY